MKDFSGQNLRGRTFNGQDLTGANFTHADIRGANFTHAILRGANFTGAKAGVQKRWVIGQLLISLLLSFVLGLLSSFVIFCALIFFTAENIRQHTTLPGILTLFVLAIFFIATVRQDDMAEAFRTGAGTIAGIVVGATTVTINNNFGRFFAVGSVIASLVSGAIIFANTVTGVITVTFSTVSSVAVASLGYYIAWRALAGKENNASVRRTAIASAATGGTTFYSADLTRANFAGAAVKSTNFRRAILTQVCWTDTKQLELARVGDSILANSAVRDLLVTRNGYNKSYVDANLRGANLNEVNLERVDLTRADLSDAIMQRANLKGANLRETLAIGTDFTAAYFTGACLESWNIDHTTKLNQVDCQYVFLLEQPNLLGGRERRPHDPDRVFAPGDFEKLYRKMINLVQILLRSGVNRKAFAEAFQALMHDNPDISYESIQAIERKGNDVLVTLEVPETADKAKIAQDFLQPYEIQLKQLESENEQLRLRSTELKDIALALAKQPLHITNQAVGDGTVMSDHTNQTVTIGGNVTGSTINLGELSGSVSNVVNQLPNSPDPAQPGLKELLLQLQAAIETTAELTTEDKADALEQVKVLAEVGQDPKQPEKESLGRKAIKMLKGTVAALPDTAKLAEACSKLLPLIARVLGLPV